MGHLTNIYYDRNHDMNKATTTDELFDITKSEYQNTEFHHLPLMLSNLFEQDMGTLIIAKGKTRIQLCHKLNQLRELIHPSVGHIGYEPNYSLFSNTSRKSYLKLEGAGYKGGCMRIARMRNLKHILLYNFVPGQDDWELVYEAAQNRTAATGGHITIHYA